MKPRIILDCDPGHDDAVAILLAAKHCEVLGITTVSGNVPLSLTSKNALLTTQILNLDIPVHAGANAPLTSPAVHAPDIHGETGLGGPILPPLERELSSHDAVRFIIDTVRQEENIWLVATGPLSNIALALKTAPDIIDRLQGISLMGGSNSFGNRTPVAEFNILADPEAADIVFSSGLNIKMCGLNLTHQFALGPSDIANIRQIANAAAIFVADMLEFFAAMYKDIYFDKPSGPLHDPCAIMALSHPELLRFEPRHVAVELQGKLTRGMTVVDERGVKRGPKHNTHLALDIDREKALELLLTSIASYE